MKKNLVVAIAILSVVALAPAAQGGELDIYWPGGHAGCDYGVAPHPAPPDVGVTVRLDCESNLKCTVQVAPTQVDCTGLPP